MYPVISDKEYRYVLYGEVLQTRVFLNHISVTKKFPATIQYNIPLTPPDWPPTTSALYFSPYPDQQSQPRLVLWPHPDGIIVQNRYVGRYWITSDHITCYPDPGISGDTLSDHLLSWVFCYWLELQGMPALHASAVNVQGGALVFLATQGGGKSTLAADFIQRGHALVTDEILAVKKHGEVFQGIPSYPQLRLWPASFTGLQLNQAIQRHLDAAHKYHIPVGSQNWGDFSSLPVPIKRIYLPERVDNPAQKINIHPIRKNQAVVELIKHTYTPHMVQAAGLSERRLAFLSQLIEQAPIYQLSFPNGYEHLDALYQAIIEDIAKP